MCSAFLLLKTLLLSFFVVRSVDSLGDSGRDAARIRDAKCGQNLPFSLKFFHCKSGDCIDGTKECDGRADCEDGSDETDDCKRIRCPKYLFTCEYGACIAKEFECDGYKNCRDNSDEEESHCEREHIRRCQKDEFRCRSGECISRRLICDGRADCDDGFDESRAACWNVECHGGKYRCSYGACVDADAECNGIVDCFDGSDEDPTNCKKSTSWAPRPPSGTRNSCVLPLHPSLGHWSIHGLSPPFSPGDYVDVGTILRVECNRDHILQGPNAIFCENGRWSASIGRCLKPCPPRISTETMKITCMYKNNETQNCTDAVEGLLAKFKCASGSDGFNLQNTPIHLCKDGVWDQTHLQCSPGQEPFAINLDLNVSVILDEDSP